LPPLPSAAAPVHASGGMSHAVSPAVSVAAPPAQALRPVTPLPRPVAPPPPPVRPVAAPSPSRRSAPACCWPIGEPGKKDFRFCDGASVPGKPYCEEHARLAYVRIRDRKEDAA
jgi:GcrA cell cycle regulator